MCAVANLGQPVTERSIRQVFGNGVMTAVDLDAMPRGREF